MGGHYLGKYGRSKYCVQARRQKLGEQDSKESSPRSLDSMLLRVQVNSQNQSTH